MIIERDHMIKLLFALQAGDREWHSVAGLIEEVEVEWEVIRFHLNILRDQGFLDLGTAASDNNPADRIESEDSDPALFRLTAQGHEFADGMLTQARMDQAWERFMQQRHLTEKTQRDDVERQVNGLTDIELVFRDS